MPPPLPLSPAEIAVLQGYLVDAKAALHKLLTGRASVEVVTQGDVVKWARPDLPQLQAYVATLEAQIAGRPIAGAIGVTWAL